MCFLCLQVFAQKTEAVYLDTNDQSKDYYLVIIPAGSAPKAFMILMPGAFQTPENVLQQTDLPYKAASEGIMTIIPLLSEGIHSFGIDSTSQTSLLVHIRDAVERYKLKGKDFYLGGFSLGGSTAIKYAEIASGDRKLLLPKAVFAIDPPLDFERYYNAATRTIRLSPQGKVSEELRYMTARIETVMEGAPAVVPGNYHRISPYSFTDENQTAVKLLLHTPLLLFTEPDIEWWLQERGYDYSLMNAVDQAAMINELQRMGNTRAVLVTTKDKGYRSGGQKHPHSFSIADNKLLLTWLLQQ